MLGVLLHSLLSVTLPSWPGLSTSGPSPTCPGQSSCYKPSRGQGRNGEGRLPALWPDLLESCGPQAVATPPGSLIKRADSLGPLRLDLGCSLTSASEQRVYWSACWSTPGGRGARAPPWRGGEFLTWLWAPPSPQLSLRGPCRSCLSEAPALAQSGSALPLDLRPPPLPGTKDRVV